MRLRKVTIKPGVAKREDWGYLWDLLDSIAAKGMARDESDVWRCQRPRKGGPYTHVFWRVASGGNWYQ